MSKLFIEDTTLTAIGEAIRTKEGSTEPIPTVEMAERIANLPSGGEIPSGENIGDILIWSGTAWEARPKWQMTYQPVEYIESTGTQRIDTLYISTNTTGMRYKASNFDFGGAEDLYFAGGRIQGGTRFAIGYYHGKWDYGFNGYYVSKIQADTSAITEFKLNYKNNRKFVVDEQIGSEIADTIVGSVAKIGLFALLYETQFTGTIYPHRLYEAEITEGETVVRHFVPAYSVIDGTIGMYETVEGKFYTNSGTGTFLKGAEI